MGMKMGRPPLPTALHIRHGTSPSGPEVWAGRGRRPIPKDEPKLPAITIDDPMPDHPDHLSEPAQVYWYGWIGTRARSLKVLTNSDLPALGLLCETWADYIAARKLVEENGAYSPDLEKILAPANRLDRLSKMAHSQFRDFGMTPSSRRGVGGIGESVSGSAGDGDGDDGDDGTRAKDGKKGTTKSGPKRFFGSRG